VTPYPLHTQQLSPYPSECLLDLAFRRFVGMAYIGIVFRRRQRLAVEFAVGRQRHPNFWERRS
ncbi:hypothetical protein BTJ49_15390, partial [Oleiagrimonas sp. MCCC 1A03011]